ncbi:hypothetical protein [Aquisphaera insulae]|uniref:hypothetical protein n=1 Tax=Aquisphaera insulae TaxID=2712864 RepID=UPI002030DBFD|nr:hypothetical protein [Aquisphaera insulae]
MSSPSQEAAQVVAVPYPIDARLAAIEAALAGVGQAVQVLVDRERVQDWYGIDELARRLGKAPFTCREWARHGRIHAVKKQSGRGAHQGWSVSHAELERIRREGLLPISRASMRVS